MAKKFFVKENKTLVEPIVINTTISSSNWSTSAPYTFTYSNSLIKEDMVFIVDIKLNSSTSTASKEAEEYIKLSKVETFNGSVKFTCLSEKPNITLNLQLKEV